MRLSKWVFLKLLSNKGAKNFCRSFQLLDRQKTRICHLTHAFIFGHFRPIFTYFFGSFYLETADKSHFSKKFIQDMIWLKSDKLLNSIIGILPVWGRLPHIFPRLDRGKPLIVVRRDSLWYIYFCIVGDESPYASLLCHQKPHQHFCIYVETKRQFVTS